MSDFWTLLGPDFAGKSTALAHLADQHYPVVSHDDRFLSGHPLVSHLRSCWVDEALQWAGIRYSSELVLSVMHSVVLHQRDELVRHADTPTIVDSYYYKPLAACQLLDVADARTFAYWRSFPQPAGILYLDLPPQAAWERASHGRRPSPFEHYPPAPSREAFTRFQTDLREWMLAEVAHLPVTIIDATAPPNEVLAQIRAAIPSSSEAISA